MPEEEAFVTFIKLMFDINVREMFKAGFADLQLKFFQLGRLIEELLPDLHAHFQELRIETHMFASQWFLTLFAAKFPLVTTYRVFDVLLSEGTIVLYQLSLALLKLAKKDLLSLEFEEVRLDRYRAPHILHVLFSSEAVSFSVDTLCACLCRSCSTFG